MMNKLFILLLLIASHAFTQTNYDTQLWAGAQGSYSFTKKFDLSCQVQLRTTNGLNQVKAIYCFINPSYQLNKHFSTEIEYRFSTSPQRDQHRFGGAITAKVSAKKWTFLNRTSIQQEYEYFNATYEQGHEPSLAIRNRIQVRYKMTKKQNLFASAEPFLQNNHSQWSINRIRCMFGTNYTFNKHHAINAAYLFQIGLLAKGNRYTHGLVLNYEFQMPYKKKKKSKKAQ